ncbi:hypothetical protein CMEL01_14013 [Colletotrichum melonis]|uniref:Heterokaryon incompatibility domain-containing protein n=1 Tax=Colletotrichum melonis TaxID=1209925 RepID=A0AAI9UU10_9PEZI|nr:hypothetical protein CMEL01_14013 [Colletotrichum melonis]
MNDDETSTNNQPNGRDTRTLCIMIYGETLYGMLAQTMSMCQVGLDGWQLDDEIGWGLSTWAAKRMRVLQWCPNAQRILKGQIGTNATLLYVTIETNVHNPRYKHPRNPRHRGSELASPWGCSEDRCLYIQANTLVKRHSFGISREWEYRPAHARTCKNGEGCELVGPSQRAILVALQEDSIEQRDGSFPILKITGDNERITLEAQPWRRGTNFATISHVWSQGLGNESKNKIQTCQLRMIRKYLKDVFKSEEDQFFWLDTLAIPSKSTTDTRKAARKAAISRIHHVFSKASHCIIIDRYMLETGNADEDCRTTAASLLTSAWIRRLWTLQEAFVSKTLHLAMRDDSGDPSDSHRKVMALDDMWGDDSEGRAFFTSVNILMKRKLAQSMMRKEEAADYRSRPQQHRNTAVLVANAWRATRYRTIDRPKDETLVLATLLNIPIPSSHVDFGEVDDVYLERLMVEFWTSISRESPSGMAIPSGLIFLPGRRLSSTGFGWAPATWMSQQEETYPFPLGKMNYSTTLHERGLQVQYPGFILHASFDRLSSIVSGRRKDPTFHFSVDRDLYEWYSVDVADAGGHIPGSSMPRVIDQEDIAEDQLSQKLQRNSLSNPKLAIILSRSRPVEVPGEIGLLVEIQEISNIIEKDQNTTGDTTVPKRQATGNNEFVSNLSSERDEDVIYCRIVRRVIVSRLSLNSASNLLPPSGNSPNESLGNSRTPLHDSLVSKRYSNFARAELLAVALDDSQRWVVDGYPQSAHLPKTEKERTMQENIKRTGRKVKKTGTKIKEGTLKFFQMGEKGV